MILTILTAGKFQKENWKEKVKKYTEERIKICNPSVVRVNHFEELFCLDKVKYKLEMSLSNNIDESDYIMVIRDSNEEDKDLELLLSHVTKDIQIKNYRI